MLTLEHSQKLFDRGLDNLVGSVNSPVRSFKAVDTPMLFVRKGRGPYLWDADGNKYIDYIMGWGVHIFGHAYKPIRSAVIARLRDGTSFGLATDQEIALAEMIKRHFASIEKVRLVNSGTEACMTALRLARAFTARTKIIKFDGCYHGHFDGLLVKSGSGNLTFGIPSGAGILPAYTRDTISVPFNDISLFKTAVEENKDDLAGVIVEPVPCNNGVILPGEGFLNQIARITRQEKAVLIFDEVITGFRLSLGGAQGLFGIIPDLTCLGKIIGGGFPVGAVGGRREIMDLLSPVGPVYQAGTLSGNPVCIAAGISALEGLAADKTLYAELDKNTAELVSAFKNEAKAAGVALAINAIGSLFSVFFTDKEVSSYADTRVQDVQRYAQFFSRFCQEGVLFPPSAFEACFVSQAHNGAVREKTIKAFKKALRAMR